MCTKSLSLVGLFMTPWTVAHQASLSVGILQARILEWVVIPSSRGLPDPGITLFYVLHWHAGSLPVVAPGKPLKFWVDAKTSETMKATDLLDLKYHHAWHHFCTLLFYARNLFYGINYKFRSFLQKEHRPLRSGPKCVRAAATPSPSAELFTWTPSEGNLLSFLFPGASGSFSEIMRCTT